MRSREKILLIKTAVLPLLLLAVAAGSAPTSKTAPGPSRFAALVRETRTRVHTISVPGLVARMNGGDRSLRLIDVREDEEWAGGSLPGAIHLSKGVIERDIEKTVPDPDATIVLFCGVGGRSILAADNLQKMGYTNVFSLEGGMRAWLDAGDPIVKK